MSDVKPWLVGRATPGGVLHVTRNISRTAAGRGQPLNVSWTAACGRYAVQNARTGGPLDFHPVWALTDAKGDWPAGPVCAHCLARVRRIADSWAEDHETLRLLDAEHRK